ncbi:uncharacterized protein LOC113295717 [Papaver somniferum]|uniref:uncharacterized protein LOC113295717 n=1 Tax=Papaver somniferum TaxID=3469 RepID=UPI000E70400D|nr:uncharacterized protein LOC113295717 [Papaver somniferum]
MFSAIVQSDPSKPEFLLTCMYGFSNYTKKKEQWSYIQQISENNSNPWVVLGDLNFHLVDNEAGTSSSSDGLVNNIVASSGLEDIGFIGKNFTWSNNNMGTGSIKSRIDMDLGNGNWYLNFPNSRLHHLSQIGSDHCPIMLDTDITTPNCWKPFKFFLTWLNDKSCTTIITNAWKSSVSGSPGYQLVSRLSYTRRELSF